MTRAEEEELLERQLAETKLPPDLQKWFDEFVGSVHCTFVFDSVELLDEYEYED